MMKKGQNKRIETKIRQSVVNDEWDMSWTSKESVATASSRFVNDTQSSSSSHCHVPMQQPQRHKVHIHRKKKNTPRASKKKRVPGSLGDDMTLCMISVDGKPKLVFKSDLSDSQ